jgi:hypothetical protein
VVIVAVGGNCGAAAGAGGGDVCASAFGPGIVAPRIVAPRMKAPQALNGMRVGSVDDVMFSP